MQTVIVTGGEGWRLRPYSTVFRKPLIPWGDRPIREVLIFQLAAQGIAGIRSPSVTWRNS
jgi:NDP-sugar pyrophosphorylase family protein